MQLWGLKVVLPAVPLHFHSHKLKPFRSYQRLSSLPATDGDLTDGVVSVPRVHARTSAVVLSPHTYSDLGGVNHLLQRTAVVEVIVAGPRVGLGSQQVQSDVAAREGHVATTQGTNKTEKEEREC